MKVGDRVKIVSTPYENKSLQPGKTGRIVKLTDEGCDDMFDVVMDDFHPDSLGDLDWPFETHELEVIA